MVKAYEPLYTIKEVSQILKVNPSDVYAKINKGELPYVLLGSKKVRGSDLERYIQSLPPVTSFSFDSNTDE